MYVECQQEIRKNTGTTVMTFLDNPELQNNFHIQVFFVL